MPDMSKEMKRMKEKGIINQNGEVHLRCLALASFGVWTLEIGIGFGVLIDCMIGWTSLHIVMIVKWTAKEYDTKDS
jgi:hypothetical protein